MSKRSVEKGSKKEEIKAEAPEEEFKPLSDEEFKKVNWFKREWGEGDMATLFKKGFEGIEKRYVSPSDGKERREKIQYEMEERGLTIEKLQELEQRRKQELEELSAPDQFSPEYEGKGGEEKYREDFQRYLENFSLLDPEEQKKRVMKEGKLEYPYFEGELFGLHEIESETAKEKVREAIMKKLIEKKKKNGGLDYGQARTESRLARDIGRMKDPSYENIALGYLRGSFLSREPSRIKEIVEILQEEAEKGKEEAEEESKGLGNARKETEKAFEEGGEEE